MITVAGVVPHQHQIATHGNRQTDKKYQPIDASGSVSPRDRRTATQDNRVSSTRACRGQQMLCTYEIRQVVSHPSRRTPSSQTLHGQRNKSAAPP